MSPTGDHSRRHRANAAAHRYRRPPRRGAWRRRWRSRLGALGGGLSLFGLAAVIPVELLAGRVAAILVGFGAVLVGGVLALGPWAGGRSAR